MLSDLSTAERALAQFMSDLSEAGWCAAWMHNLEFELWSALVHINAEPYGRHVISESDRARLRLLSEACGGWIYFDDKNEEMFIPTEKWELLFREWQSAHGSTDANK